MLCKLVVSLQMQNRKTTDKINEISIVPNPPNYSIVAIADQRALHLHFATDNQLAKPCTLQGPPTITIPNFYYTELLNTLSYCTSTNSLYCCVEPSVREATAEPLSYVPSWAVLNRWNVPLEWNGGME